jgi:hypothetical protein
LPVLSSDDVIMLIETKMIFLRENYKDAVVQSLHQASTFRSLFSENDVSLIVSQLLNKHGESVLEILTGKCYVHQ